MLTETYHWSDEIKKGQPCAIALGYFDGVHLGHTAVINAAKEKGLKTVVVTFERHPSETLKNRRVLNITCNALKERIFASMGVDAVEYLDFDEVRDFPPHLFIARLTRHFDVKYINCGFNYHFGKDAAADATALREICGRLGIETGCVEPVCIGGHPISSTRIRGLIENGEVREAHKLLGRPFAFYGEVLHGRQLGRSIGAPTINQLIEPSQLAPRYGVYTALAHLYTHDGEDILPAIANVGVKPTVNGEAPGVETHILNFDGDLYGQNVRVDLIDFIRPEMKFGGIEELKAQIARDIDTAVGKKQRM